MVANQKIIAAINEQIGMSSARCCSITPSAAYFDAEALLELSAHFHKQAEEEKQHALRFIQFVTDTGARVKFLSPFVAGNQEQTNAVLLVLKSRDLVTSIRGPAGSGKTTTMQNPVGRTETCLFLSRGNFFHCGFQIRLRI